MYPSNVSVLKEVGHNSPLHKCGLSEILKKTLGNLKSTELINQY